MCPLTTFLSLCGKRTIVSRGNTYCWRASEHHFTDPVIPIAIACPFVSSVLPLSLVSPSVIHAVHHYNVAHSLSVSLTAPPRLPQAAAAAAVPSAVPITKARCASQPRRADVRACERASLRKTTEIMQPTSAAAYHPSLRPHAPSLLTFALRPAPAPAGPASRSHSRRSCMHCYFEIRQLRES